MFSYVTVPRWHSNRSRCHTIWRDRRPFDFNNRLQCQQGGEYHQTGNQRVHNQGLCSTERGPNVSKVVTVSSHWKSRTPLDWENFVVLQTNQALIGLVAPHLLAVSVKATDDEAVLYFAFERDDFDNQEDADDICAELDVFLEGRSRSPQRCMWVRTTNHGRAARIGASIARRDERIGIICETTRAALGRPGAFLV